MLLKAVVTKNSVVHHLICSCYKGILPASIYTRSEKISYYSDFNYHTKKRYLRGFQFEHLPHLFPITAITAVSSSCFICTFSSTYSVIPGNVKLLEPTSAAEPITSKTVMYRNPASNACRVLFEED